MNLVLKSEQKNVSYSDTSKTPWVPNHYVITRSFFFVHTSRSTRTIFMKSVWFVQQKTIRFRAWGRSPDSIGPPSADLLGHSNCQTRNPIAYQYDAFIGTRGLSLNTRSENTRLFILHFHKKKKKNSRLPYRLKEQKSPFCWWLVYNNLNRIILLLLLGAVCLRVTTEPPPTAVRIILYGHFNKRFLLIELTLV